MNMLVQEHVLLGKIHAGFYNALLSWAHRWLI